MSHPEPELLALIALGEDAESHDQHVSGCVQCRSEVDQLAAIVAIARDGDGAEQLTSPPPDLWGRIAAATGVETGPRALAQPEPARPEPVPLEPARGLAARTGPWYRRHPLAAAVAGAAAGLIIGAGGAIGARQLTAQPPAARVVASIPLRPLPQFPQWQAARGTAVMRAGPDGRQLRVTLTAPKRAGFYEVWLLARDGVSMISLGDLGARHTGRFDMPPGVDLRNYSRIDVSLQPFDGSTRHAKTSVVRGTVPR